LLIQDIAVDLLPDAPEQKHRGAARLTRQRAARFLDHAAQFGKQPVRFWGKQAFVE
jgi:hypothetical protein